MISASFFHILAITFGGWCLQLLHRYELASYETMDCRIAHARFPRLMLKLIVELPERESGMLTHSFNEAFDNLLVPDLSSTTTSPSSRYSGER